MNSAGQKPNASEHRNQSIPRKRNSYPRIYNTQEKTESTICRGNQSIIFSSGDLSCTFFPLDRLKESKAVTSTSKISRYQKWKVRPMTNPILKGSVFNINTKRINGIIPVNRIPVSLYDMKLRDPTDPDGNRGLIKRSRRIFFLAV